MSIRLKTQVYGPGTVVGENADIATKAVGTKKLVK